MTVSRCLSGGYTFLDALLLLRYPPRATLERLDWTDVKIAEKRVIVPSYKGKNQLRYRVTLSDNALEWLRLHVHEKGSFLVAAQATNRPGMEKSRPSETGTRRLVLRAARRVGVTLPENAGRNTFISMHVAHYESIDKMALEADTSATIIKNNYLDIVTREDAARYWAIRPLKRAGVPKRACGHQNLFAEIRTTSCFAVREHSRSLDGSKG
jgi:hypothetical protein